MVLLSVSQRFLLFGFVRFLVATVGGGRFLRWRQMESFGYKRSSCLPMLKRKSACWAGLAAAARSPLISLFGWLVDIVAGS